MDRRSLLRFCSLVGAPAVCGCTDILENNQPAQNPDKSNTTVERDRQTIIDPEQLDGYVKPDTESPIDIESLECVTDHHGRVSSRSRSPSYGEVKAQTREGDQRMGFALRIGEKTVTPNGQFEITLTNISNKPLVRGNSSKFNIEVETDAGWEDVRVWTTETKPEYPAELILQKSGDEYVWTFTWEDGTFVTHSLYEERMTVCPGVPEGRYRFSYWGIPSRTLAVEFDVRR